MVRDGKTTEQSIGTEKLTPLANELLLGSLRFWFSLSKRVDAHLSRPFRAKDQDLYALLIVGAYQLLHMRVPDHAAINETVGAAGQLKKPWARGMTNAVLRAICSERDDISDSPDRSFELPEWMVDKFSRDFPDEVDALGLATVERAPMSLRVNTTRTEPESYRRLLENEGITCHNGYFPEHLILATPLPVSQLPGYEQGLVSVQDAGAQFAAHLAGDAGPRRILDACAAPGGKLFHLAERFPEAEIVGLELSTERLAHLKQEANRLGHPLGNSQGKSGGESQSMAKLRLIAGDATGQGVVCSRRRGGSGGL